VTAAESPADAAAQDAIAMRSNQQMLLPLVLMQDFDEYTMTHACNVSVLAMGLAEGIGCSRTEVRAFGAASLLHDIEGRAGTEVDPDVSRAFATMVRASTIAPVPMTPKHEAAAHTPLAPEIAPPAAPPA